VRRTLLIPALVAALAVAAATAAVARADAPKFETNLYFNCQGDNNIGVPVGSDLVLRYTWAARTRGLVQDFLDAQTPLSAVVDGAAVANPERYWTGPYYNATAGYWAATWRYDTGIISSFDHPYTIDIESFATHRLLDGFVFADDQTHRPLFAQPGDPLVSTGGPCSVTSF
jgi:hypothetical protein